jgi:hypothetical protein
MIMTKLPISYVDVTVVISALMVLIILIHLTIVSRNYLMFKDLRSGSSLLVGILLAVACFGVATSGFGLLLPRHEAGLFTVIGLSIARGALVCGGFTLVLVDVEEWKRRKCGAK